MSLARLQSKAQEISDKLHKHELDLTNAKNDITNLCDRIKDRYRLSLTESNS